VRGRDRVDHQLACRRASANSQLDHPPNLPAPQAWQYPGVSAPSKERN
jgi:hypothetical protein